MNGLADNSFDKVKDIYSKIRDKFQEGKTKNIERFEIKLKNWIKPSTRLLLRYIIQKIKSIITVKN